MTWVHGRTQNWWFSNPEPADGGPCRGSAQQAWNGARGAHAVAFLPGRRTHSGRSAEGGCQERGELGKRETQTGSQSHSNRVQARTGAGAWGWRTGATGDIPAIKRWAC